MRMSLRQRILNQARLCRASCNCELREPAAAVLPCARLGSRWACRPLPPQAPPHSTATPQEMQAEAEAAPALTLLTTGKKQRPLLLPTPIRNRLCKVRIYGIILMSKLKSLVSCHHADSHCRRRCSRLGDSRGSRQEPAASTGPRWPGRAACTEPAPRGRLTPACSAPGSNPKAHLGIKAIILLRAQLPSSQILPQDQQGRRQRSQLEGSS